MIINITLATICLAGLIFFGGRVIKDMGYEFYPKIPSLFFFDISKKLSVSPTQINLRADRFGVLQQIKISNLTNAPVYQVQIKITLEEGDMDFLGFEPTPFKEKGLFKNIVSNSDSYQLGLDYSFLIGKDSQGKKAVILFVRALDPGDTFSIKWNIFAENIKKDSIIKLQVLDSSDLPPQIVHSPQGVFMQITPKENFTIESIMQSINKDNN